LLALCKRMPTRHDLLRAFRQGKAASQPGRVPVGVRTAWTALTDFEHMQQLTVQLRGGSTVGPLPVE